MRRIECQRWGETPSSRKAEFSNVILSDERRMATACEAGLDLSIQSLRQRDNHTNVLYLARIYAVIAATIAAVVWLHGQQSAWGLSWWWNLPLVLTGIVVLGACQHQLGGATHEATHYMLFRSRRLNELVSDWLCMFPLYTSTYQYRIHHLAHHQFVNDPERDPDISQLRDSGHWLDFPVDHVTFLWTLLKQLWLPNLVRYTLTRARYSSLGVDSNPFHDPAQRPSKWPNRVGIAYAVLAPVILGRVAAAGNALWLGAVSVGLWGAVAGFLAILPEARFPAARIQPVISHRATTIGRVTFMALLYGAVSWSELLFKAPAGVWFLLLWVVPLFTTFPLFMILRQWVQHGNGDRGRLTNTRVFLVNPLIRFAVFPFGMDYHLPHHLYASIPHYNLKRLHEVLLQNPDYAREGVVVEGYLGRVGALESRPSVLDVLGARGAAARSRSGEVYIDHHALDDAEVSDAAAIARQAELSARNA